MTNSQLPFESIASLSAQFRTGQLSPVMYVEALGVLPFSRVAVRGREEQQNLFALGDLDTGDVDGLGRGPEKRLNRSLVANDFFERAAGE